MASTTEPPGRRTLPYLASLDGLRAVSVAAVVAYHVSPGKVPGGFLGVDVFFVISGYLITSLLLGEIQGTGHVDLRGFWVRRARRLLPAAFALIAVVSAVAVLRYRAEVPRIRGDVGGSVLYVNNWHAIAVGASYFERLQRPSPLRHLWSLAVEEQFYLLWPLLLPWLATRRAAGARGGSEPSGISTRTGRVLAPRAAVAAVLAAGALGSTLLMAVLYRPGSDPSRVYFGTDTRAAALLVGALLAVVWTREPWWWTEPLGVLALGGLGAVFLFAHDLDAWLYRGGFLGVALISAGAIVGASAPGSRFAAALGIAPLRWLGTRSYGIYLWHWPVVVVTRPRLDVNWSPSVVLAVRLGVTLLLSEASWRLVEQPVRNGALARLSRSLRGVPSAGGAAFRWRRIVAGGLVLVAVGSTGSLAAALVSEPAHVDPIAASLRDGEAALLGGEAVERPGQPVPSRNRPVQPPVVPTVAHRLPRVGPAAPGAGDASTAVAGPAADGAVTAATDGATVAAAPDPSGASGPSGVVPTTVAPAGVGPTAVAPADVAPATVGPSAVAPATVVPTTVVPTTTIPRPGVVLDLRVTAVGDSVMLGTARELKAWLGRQAVIDAKVGRQFEEGLKILQRLRDRGRLGEVVIIHLGDNGPPSTRQLDRLRAITQTVPALIIVNLSIPLDFEGKANAALARWVATHTGTALVDWNGIVQANPGVLYDDKLHVRPLGAALYGQALAKAIIERCDLPRAVPTGPVPVRVLTGCDRARPPTPSTVVGPTPPGPAAGA